jgi:hypothetical protein
MTSRGPDPAAACRSVVAAEGYDRDVAQAVSFIATLVVVLGTGSSQVHAQPGAPAGAPPAMVDESSVPPSPEVAALVGGARRSARAGDCTAAVALGDRIRRLEPDYFARVVAIDPVITSCRAGVDTRPVARLTESRRRDLGEKDPTIATSLSLGTTLAGAGMLALAYAARDTDAGDTFTTIGLLTAAVGPTVGHIYADDIGSGGLYLRLASPVPATIAFAIMMSCNPIFGPDDCSATEEGISVGLVVAAGAMYVGGTVWEIASAGDAARKTNRERGFDRIAVVPAPITSSDGTVPGLVVAGGF